MQEGDYTRHHPLSISFIQDSHDSISTQTTDPGHCPATVCCCKFLLYVDLSKFRVHLLSRTPLSADRPRRLIYPALRPADIGYVKKCLVWSSPFPICTNWYRARSGSCVIVVAIRLSVLWVLCLLWQLTVDTYYDSSSRPHSHTCLLWRSTIGTVCFGLVQWLLRPLWPSTVGIHYTSTFLLWMK